MSNFPQSNRTYQIVHDAVKHGYAVGGYCVYNTDGVLATIRAAEHSRSPAIIQVFPWTLHFHGPPFIQYIATLAHNASVPISVHLDHCLKPSDAELALTCAFDSIMVDGSMFDDEEEGIEYIKSVVEKATEKGILVEAELGRMEGSEDGLPKIEESKLTDPMNVQGFVERTGVHLLAPSFGNMHGGPVGVDKLWDVDRLKAIYEALGSVTPLVLHGTYPCSDEMLKVAIANGMRKVNQNRRVRLKYMDFLARGSGKLELTKLQEEGVEIYAQEIEEIMALLGSKGRG
ncbi:aldolase [Amniculicola lignicola CBS 123094]|uniref:Fructose-bisphosphate aldolase n=1 Tax=Amniculicola lignicola CBS 123094 TaxID=1392246 RepID=A0A6A5X3I9_9PLEO|nr:aldolase [Amniculicola lignicola CBS 123094]